MGATDEASCCSSSVAQQDNRIFRGIAQLVEQRSPKPRAVGSNPTAPEMCIRDSIQIEGYSDVWVYYGTDQHGVDVWLDKA